MYTLNKYLVYITNRHSEYIDKVNIGVWDLFNKKLLFIYNVSIDLPLLVKFYIKTMWLRCINNDIFIFTAIFDGHPNENLIYKLHYNLNTIKLLNKINYGIKLCKSMSEYTSLKKTISSHTIPGVITKCLPDSIFNRSLNENLLVSCENCGIIALYDKCGKLIVTKKILDYNISFSNLISNGYIIVKCSKYIDTDEYQRFDIIYKLLSNDSLEVDGNPTAVYLEFDDMLFTAGEINIYQCEFNGYDIEKQHMNMSIYPPSFYFSLNSKCSKFDYFSHLYSSSVIMKPSVENLEKYKLGLFSILDKIPKVLHVVF